MLPLVCVSDYYTPEVWEKALREIWGKGIASESAYDENGSIEVTLVAEILRPSLEWIHLCMPTGMQGLEEYRQSVLYGTEDSQIEPGKKDYTYHDRLFNWKGIDQIEYMVNTIWETTHTRRAQAIIWESDMDTKTTSPPCLQRIWGKLHRSPSDLDKYILSVNLDWRSRDFIGAWLMNIFALTSLCLHVIIPKLISKIREEGDEEVFIELGRIVDKSDSAHIYAKDFEKAQAQINKMTEYPTWTGNRAWHVSKAAPLFKQAQATIPSLQVDEYWSEYTH